MKLTNKELDAEKAVIDLQEAIDNDDSDAVLSAYELVKSFNWDEVPDYLFEDWDELVDKGNAIIYGKTS